MKTLRWLFMLGAVVGMVSCQGLKEAKPGDGKPLSQDETFQQYIRQLIATAQVVNVADCNLTNLDVSHSTNLTDLRCDNNRLTILDISHIPNLTRLSCDHNQLTNLDTSTAPMLEELRCVENRITNLDLSHNLNLKSLDCSANGLRNLDLSSNTNLVALTCYGNQLTNLDISHNASLHGLCCSGNQLTTLDVSACSNLFFLQCTHNQLKAIDISRNTKLRSLQLRDNHVTNLDISANEAELWEVDARRNPLSEILVWWFSSSRTNQPPDLTLSYDSNPTFRNPPHTTASLKVQRRGAPVRRQWTIDGKKLGRDFFFKRYEPRTNAVAIEIDDGDITFSVRLSDLSEKDIEYLRTKHPEGFPQKFGKQAIPPL